MRSELLRRANRFSIFRRRVQETKVDQANCQPTLFEHIFLKIRMVKCVSSHRLPELRARAAWEHEQTVFIKPHNFDDASTSEHKSSLNEDSENRLQHRHAVVGQDLCSQWIQCYTTKTETAQETMKSLQKVVAATSEARY